MDQSHHREKQVLVQPQCMTFHEDMQIWTVWRPASTLTHVMDQFAQMKTILIYFLGPRQEATRTAFCNYLASEVENLEKRDFQTLINELVKLLSGIQSRVEKRNRQP